MGRMYTVTAEAAAVTAAADMLEINAPSDACVVIHKVFLGQDSDAGDAQAEMLRVQFLRATTGGSGGGTPTANPKELGDAAFGGTIESFNSTDATGLTTIEDETFNAQAGFFHQPAPEERNWISPSGRIVIFLEKDPGDALDLVVSALIEEIGG